MRKKMFLTLCTVLSLFFLISYLLIYALFRSALFSEIRQQQANLQQYNETIFTSYIDSFNMVPFQLVNDEEIGTILNTDSSDFLDMFLARESLRKKFNRYLNQQLFSSNLDCRFILYLNDQLPLARYCDSYSLSEHILSRTSQVYSSQVVSSSTWYQRTLASRWSPYFFLNEETKELCYARCSWNYSQNLSVANGIGIIIIAIPESSFLEKLSLNTITPNSSFVLSNEYDEILYARGIISEHMPPHQLIAKAESSDQYLLDGQKYITSTAAVNNDLFLTFFTPYSDIEIMVQSALKTYSFFICCFFPILIGILYLLSYRITAPIISLAKLIGTIDDTRNFDTRQFDVWKEAELRILCRSFSEMIQKENALILRIMEESQAKRAAVLHALQAQINPHFLYNALDIVSWMALSKQEDTIADTVSSISNMMHYGISHPEDAVPICQELDNIREFIRIYQLELPCTIDLSVQASEEQLSQTRIPKFTLQPLVENAILHNPDLPALSITVCISTHNQCTMITVTDSGSGADPRKLNAFLHYEETDLPVSNGFGIRNVNERLQLHYGNGSCLSYTQTEDKKLTAILTIIPQ